MKTNTLPALRHAPSFDLSGGEAKVSTVQFSGSPHRAQSTRHPKGTTRSTRKLLEDTLTKQSGEQRSKEKDAAPPLSDGLQQWTQDLWNAFANMFLDEEETTQVIPPGVLGGVQESTKYHPPCPEIITGAELLLGLRELKYSVQINVDVATVNLVGQWITPHVPKTKQPLLLLIPIGHYSVVHKCDVYIGNRMLDTLVVDCNALMEKHTIARHPQGSMFESMTWIPSLFRLVIPDVPHGTTVQIEAQYTQQLLFDNGSYSMSIPLTFPISTVSGYTGLQEFIRMEMSINAGYSNLNWDSTHSLQMVSHNADRLVLKGNRKVTWPNKDFGFSYSIPTTKILPLVHCFPKPEIINDEGLPLNTLSLYIYPSTSKQQVLPRQLVFLINRSHTLKGAKLKTLFSGLDHLLQSLHPQDKYYFIVFQPDALITEHGVTSFQQANEDNINATKEWFLEVFYQEFDDPMSPTATPDDEFDVMAALQPAIERMYEVFQTLAVADTEASVESNTLKACVVLTDCEVGEDIERECCELVKTLNMGIRFYGFGIGRFCNSCFLKALSNMTQGYTEVVIDAERLLPAFEQFMKSISAPLMTDINLFIRDGPEVELYPPMPPDLFADKPVHVIGSFYGDIPKTLVVSGYLADGIQVTEVVDVATDSLLDFSKMFLVHTVDHYAVSAWLGQSDVIDNKLLTLSCEYKMAYVGWNTSTTMVCVDTTSDQHAEIIATHKAEMQTMSAREFNSFLIEKGILDNEVKAIGATILVFEHISQTRVGEVQVQMEEIESTRRTQLQQVVQDERQTRISLVQEEIIQLRQDLQTLEWVAHTHKQQRLALETREETDRTMLEQSQELAFKTLLKKTRSERQVQANSGLGTTEEHSASHLDITTTAESHEWRSTLNTDNEHPHSDDNLLDSTKQPTKESNRKSAQGKLLDVEEQEEHHRDVILMEQSDIFAHVELRYSKEATLARRKEDRRKELETFPKMSRKWKARRLESKQQETHAGSKLEGDEALDGGDLWRMVTGVKMATVHDIQWLLQQMAQHQTEATITVEALNVLSHLSSDKESQALVVSQGGIQKVIQAMRLHHNLEIQQLGCHILNILSSPKNNALIDRDSGVWSILQAMRSWQDCAPLISSGLKCLHSLAQSSAAHRRTVAKKGGINAVLQAMVQFERDPDMLTLAVTTLGSLGIATETATDNQNGIATNGGVELIFQAMRSFPNNLNVLTACVQALDHLSNLNNFNKSVMMSGGATSLILSTMMSFPNNIKLLTHAISALTTLASNIYACESIVNQGGIPMLIECVAAFPHQIKLLTKARHCIELLKRVDREGSNNIRKANPISFVRCRFEKNQQVVDVKLIGYAGSVDFMGLAQSVQSTFQQPEGLVMKFNTADTENVTLTIDNLDQFLDTSTKRLLCITADEASLYQEERIVAKSQQGTVVGHSSVPDPRLQTQKVILRDQLRSKHMVDWNTIDIHQWLTVILEMPHYTEIFSRNCPNGNELLKITDVTLDSYNITTRRDKTRILRSIEDFRGKQYSFTR